MMPPAPSRERDLLLHAVCKAGHSNAPNLDDDPDTRQHIALLLERDGAACCPE